MGHFFAATAGNRLLHSAIISLSLLTLFFFPADPVSAAEQDSSGHHSNRILSLAEAQRMALAANPSMEAALARVEQARARVEQASAAWRPSLDLHGGANRQYLSDTRYQSSQALAALFQQETERNPEEYTVDIKATWLLFDGFARRYREEQTKLGEQAFTAAHREGQRLLLLAVAEAFVNAQLKQTLIAIHQADALFYQQQLGDAQHRYDAGAGPWGDILNIRVQVNGAKSSLLQAQREYEAACYGLAALLGIEDAILPTGMQLEELAPGAPVEPLAADAQQLINTAIASRPDILQLQLQAEQAKVGLEAVKASFYPTVQAAGSVLGARENDPGLQDEDVGAMIGLNLAWNLYSGGADRARLAEIRQQAREIQLQLADLRNGVAAEIRQHLALLAAAREQVILQQETVKLVEENRDLAKNQYEAGETSLVRLNEAQRDLNTTYSRLAQAQVGFVRARQLLMASTGENLVSFTPPGGMEKK